MRDFTWKVFTLTGDIDAYMLYRTLEDEDEEVDEDSLETDEQVLH
ncbi:MAG: YqzL family protein [Alicyclobacillaceae bacterium]|nr:YqzL family protein [Alicyclobacillus sp. SP_1]MCY0888475.1 YqzL family protein [Alicyclobacillaceae bacterium]MCY0895183.1 YqzL family protein [Alicyclobacillaceae bacterium]